MTKAEFVKSVAEVAGKSQAQTEEILGTAFQVMAELIEAREQVGWPGFGSFKVVDRAARSVKNPQSGDWMEIPASKAVKFSAARGLKDTINR